MFSGQTIYSSFQLSTLYLFTCPTFASFGFFYQDLSKRTLLSHPEIYKLSGRGACVLCVRRRREDVLGTPDVELPGRRLRERALLLLRPSDDHVACPDHRRRWARDDVVMRRLSAGAVVDGLLHMDEHHF